LIAYLSIGCSLKHQLDRMSLQHYSEPLTEEEDMP